MAWELDLNCKQCPGAAGLLQYSLVSIPQTHWSQSKSRQHHSQQWKTEISKTGCRFRLKPATHSGLNLPCIPVQTCHPFRTKLYHLQGIFRNAQKCSLPEKDIAQEIVHIFLKKGPYSILQKTNCRRNKWQTGESKWKS